MTHHDRIKKTVLPQAFFEAAPTVNTFLGVGVTLFVARQSVDFIGLTTTQVGVGSTGQFVGIGVTLFDLVHFIDAGVGDNHSLKTQLPNIVKGELEKNLVSVVGSGTHGLQTNDTITIDVKSGITTTVTVKYNKDNRKAVYNPLDFVAAGVVTSGVAVTTTNRIPSTIEIKDHRLTTGTKVIHTSDDPIGLDNNKEYFVYVVDVNTLKFVEIWDNEDSFNNYFEKRVERSGADFERLLAGPPVKECFTTDDWGYGLDWKS